MLRSNLGLKQISGQSRSRGVTLDLRAGSAWFIAALTAVGCAAVAPLDEPGTDNAPPTATVVLEPEAPSRRDPIHAIVDASDPDGDPLTLSYRWMIEDRQAPYATDTLPAGTARRGDRVQVIVTVDDGQTQVEVTADTILVNAPPSVEVALSPERPDARDTLTAVAHAEDPDADRVDLTYRWEIDGEPLAVDDRSLPAGTARRDQVVAVTVEARDALGATSTDTDTVTLGNASPSAPRVAILPAQPNLHDALTCALTELSSDADGDPVTYRVTWTRDEAPWTGATATLEHADDTISADETWPDQVWRCVATATDGIDDVPSEPSVPVTIEGTTRIFSFTDTTAIDISLRSLKEWFEARPPEHDEFLFFEVSSATTSAALCAERADWYADAYLLHAATRGSALSGTWNKWTKIGSGEWSAPSTRQFTNHFGTFCGSHEWSWCPESGLGIIGLSIHPGHARDWGECRMQGQWSHGADWELAIRIGPDRQEVCGL